MRVIALLAAAALSPPTALGNCETGAAAAVARQFWEGHSHFFRTDDPELRTLTTARFYSALQHEWACLAKRSACLGYRPWPNPDDKHFADYPTFDIPVSRPDLSSVTGPEHVLVTMTFAMMDVDGKVGPDQFVVLTLMHGPGSQCWLVDDVVTPERGSLRLRLRGPDS
ncbi:MAG: hypothetical protein JO184_01805 [Gammaproteobacteria bacterium]|nr:hypothetical protein [Gammaproteobacteria bacterium]